MNTDILFELVEQYDIITIYRHVSPDADALGAQFGLKQWIQETYPQKQVYALGRDAGSKQSLFPQMDVVPDETVAASLAIILDTANGARVDDDRWSKAARTLKIDHHIVVESFADVEVVEDLFGATCEMLAYMFEQKQLRLSATCAQYLYGGIIADTLRFSIATIKPRTLRTAAYLLEIGRRIYNGSLRSKNRTINDIANRYQGGGHRFACGVKGLYEETIQELLQELCERVNE